MCRCGGNKWKTVIYLLVQRAESRWFLCRAPSPSSSTWLSCFGTRPATKRADEHQSTRCITSQIGSIQQIKLRAKEQNNLSTTAQSGDRSRKSARNWLPLRFYGERHKGTESASRFPRLCADSRKFPKAQPPFIWRFEWISTNCSLRKKWCA